MAWPCFSDRNSDPTSQGLTIHQGDVQSTTHVVLDTAHEPTGVGGRALRWHVCSTVLHRSSFQSPVPPHRPPRGAHILSSRQIFGPMTLAAPLTMRKARCSSGHGWGRPHLYFLARGSEHEQQE